MRRLGCWGVVVSFNPVSLPLGGHRIEFKCVVGWGGLVGAWSGSRTRMANMPRDFKSLVSTDSTIQAILSHLEQSPPFLLLDTGSGGCGRRLS